MPFSLDVLIARLDRGGERRFPGGDRVTEAPAEKARPGQPGHQRRPLGTRLVVGEERERALGGLDRLDPSVERPLNSRELGQNARVELELGVLVDLFERAREQHLGAVPIAGDAVADAASREQIDPSHGDLALGSGNTGPQVERALGELGGLAVGVNLPGRQRGLNGGPQRGRLSPPAA